MKAQKLRFQRVDESYYKVFLDELFIASMTKNPWYHETPWVIDRISGGNYVSKSGHDCFSFRVAKQLVREELVPAFLKDRGIK